MITLICFVLTLVGSINWLLIGLVQFDFVAGIFGSQASVVSRLLYVIIGLCAIWLVVSAFKNKGKINITKDEIFSKKINNDMLSDLNENK